MKIQFYLFFLLSALCQNNEIQFIIHNWYNKLYFLDVLWLSFFFFHHFLFPPLMLLLLLLLSRGSLLVKKGNRREWKHIALWSRTSLHTLTVILAHTYCWYFTTFEKFCKVIFWMFPTTNKHSTKLPQKK